MSTHKHFDKICYVILVFTLILTIAFMNAEGLGIPEASAVMGYEKALFDTTTVHTINIIMDDWDEFIENCTSGEYYNCTLIIDNEAYKNTAIRVKGNTSLTQVEAYGNNRYSFKIEFDHYDSNNTYYGLDKLCLNNIIQDNTYMKDYLTYQMMNDMGVASPLCSYVYITVNSEDWGLYLAVEGVEESFLVRNYGNDYGELYKPDSINMGSGPDNSGRFPQMPNDVFENVPNAENPMPNVDMHNNGNGNAPTPGGDMHDDINGGMQGGSMHNGSDDVLLKYIDDEYDSYLNIFDNAKTNISDADKDRLIESLKKLNNNEDLDRSVDIEAVIKYFVVHNFVLNFDSYTGSMIHNYYLYEEDGQLQMIPWDYNLAFGGFQSTESATSLVNYPIDSPVNGGTLEDRPMISWIFENEEYTKLYHQYFGELIFRYFDSGYFEETIGTVTSMISPYIEKDPTKFCTYEEFETGIDTLKKFCLLRAESISSQLDGTIGSTTETQEDTALIEANDIQISEMGSMEHSRNNAEANHTNWAPENPQKMPNENLQGGRAAGFAVYYTSKRRISF